MKKAALFVSLVIVATLAACTKRDAVNADSPKPGSPVASVSATPANDPFTIHMERGPCFGTCPIYSVELKSTGDVKFKGVRFVIDSADHAATVPSENVKALHEKFVQGNFGALDSTYANGAKGCQSYHTDAPTVTITLSDAKGSKTVVHDHGCMGAPAILNTLEATIDSVANTSQWMKPEKAGKP